MKNFAKFWIFVFVAFSAEILCADKCCEDAVILSIKSKAPEIIKPRVTAASVTIFGKDRADKFVLNFLNVLCDESSGLSKKDNVGLYIVDVCKIDNPDATYDCFGVIGAVKISKDGALKELLSSEKYFCKEIDGWTFVSNNNSLLDNEDLTAWIISDIKNGVKNDIMLSFSPIYLAEAAEEFEELVKNDSTGDITEEDRKDTLAYLASIKDALSDCEDLDLSARIEAKRISFRSNYKAKNGSKTANLFEQCSSSSTKMYMYDVVQQEDLVAKANICKTIKYFRADDLFQRASSAIGAKNSYGIFAKFSQDQEELIELCEKIEKIILKYASGDVYGVLTKGAAAGVFVAIDKNDEVGSFSKELDLVLSQRKVFNSVEAQEKYKEFKIYSIEKEDYGFVAFNDDVLILVLSFNGDCEKHLYSFLDEYKDSEDRRVITISDGMISEGFFDFGQFLSAFCKASEFSNVNLKINFLESANGDSHKLKIDVKNDELKEYILAVEEYLKNQSVKDGHMDSEELDAAYTETEKPE